MLGIENIIILTVTKYNNNNESCCIFIIGAGIVENRFVLFVFDRTIIMTVKSRFMFLESCIKISKFLPYYWGVFIISLKPIKGRSH